MNHLTTRRTALKQIGAVSLISTSPALACTKASLNTTSDTSGAISVYQRRVIDRELVTLTNHSDTLVRLDETTPLRVSRIKRALRISPNTVTENGVALKPGRRISFSVITA